MLQLKSMNIKNIITILILLIIGFIIGFLIAPKSVSNEHYGAMHHAMDMMTMNLQGLSGPEFDKAFLNEMILHHEGAVDMAEMVLEQSQNETLRAFAQEIIDVQSSEIDQMNQWLTEWSR